MRRTTLAGALLALCAVILGLTATPAWAHASLVSSTPSQGEQLDRLPAEAVLTFSQDMSGPAYVVVSGPDGTSVTEGDPVVDGTEVRQSLGEGEPGGYTLAYRVVSADGHPITGELDFQVGTGGSAPSAPAEPDAGNDGDADTGDDPDEASSAEPESADPAQQLGFWEQHGVHVAVGALLFVAALGLLLLSRRRDADE